MEPFILISGGLIYYYQDDLLKFYYDFKGINQSPNPDLPKILQPDLINIEDSPKYDHYFKIESPKSPLNILSDNSSVISNDSDKTIKS